MKILVVGGFGYIGSRLIEHLIKRYSTTDIKILDECMWGSPKFDDILKDEFLNMKVTSKGVEEYDVIIYLAGHSSVAMCCNNEQNALVNNVINFKYFLDRIVPGQKFIFASTASIFHSIENEDHSRGIYDLSMYDRELLAKDKIHNSKDYKIAGLRFATVNGYSPNFRPDLMINKMFLDACTKGEITLKAAHTKRPILFIDDLCEKIMNIIDYEHNLYVGIGSLATAQGSVYDYGKVVSEIMNVPLKVIPNTNSYYDFELKDNSAFFNCGKYFDFTDSVIKILTSLLDKKDFLLNNKWSERM